MGKPPFSRAFRRRGKLAPCCAHRPTRTPTFRHREANSSIRMSCTAESRLRCKCHETQAGRCAFVLARITSGHKTVPKRARRSLFN
jgi:hypothetical protein